MVAKNLVSPSYKVFRLHVGQTITHEDLIQTLQDLRYSEEKIIEEPGSYALRGGAVEIYPLSYRAPIRVQFHLDQIESIRDYSLHEGKSITAFEELFLLPVTDTFLKRRARLRAHLEEFEPVLDLEDIRAGD